MNRPLRFFTLSSLAVVVACGGRVEDVPSAPGSATPDSRAPGSAAPSPYPDTPAAPLPAPAGLVADASTTPRAKLPATTRERAARCGARLGEGISGGDVQGVWEASGAGQRLLAAGQLASEHHLNQVLGAVGEDVFVETWSGTLDDRYGIVRVAAADASVSEVAPLTARGSVRRPVRWRGALWGLRGTALVRITADGVQVVASDVGPSARVVLRTSGVVVVDGTRVRRVRQDGTLVPVGEAVQIGGAPYGEAWDVHPDGTVVHADGKELRRSDLPTPLAVSVDPITSVRLDAAAGSVAFAVRRPSPALTSLFVLDAGGMHHVLASDRHLTQGTESPFVLVASEVGRLTVATTCSDDEDAPSTMPVHVEAATGAVSYVVDEPAYPYVRDMGRLLDVGVFPGDDTWLDSAAPRFFLRR